MNMIWKIFLMVGFFMLRRLIQLSKVTSRIRHSPMVVFACPTRLSHVDIRHAWDIYETYDMVNERRMTKKPLYISNQFVHACVSFVARDKTRNWSDVYIVSDFDRSDCIWRIPIAAIRELFLAASRDSVSYLSIEYDAEKRHYDILTD